MIDSAALTPALQRVVLELEDDLRKRVEGDADLRSGWSAEHAEAVRRGRTAAAWVAWRDDRVTQAAVGWVLTTVFVRFCEDNGLVGPVWIAGRERRRQEALDAQLAFFRAHPLDTDREWLLQAVEYLSQLPATAELVGQHAALHLVGPSGDAATKLLTFWRQRTDSGRLVYDFTDSGLSTRFLGDLYQDLSAYAKAAFALLQTPVFVEEFILDRTLEPALAERPLEGFRLIDPACGSGHFLLGAFNRLLDRWQKHAPATELQALVQQALDAVHGVDLNPFAVAIARFRLTVAAMAACGLRSIEQAPAFRFHLAVGDSLLHGPGQQTLAGDADLSGFAYATEDLNVLQTILAGGRYDAVVGNPPYITVKDKVLNQAYRDRYPSCKGTYALTVPFMERFFGLAAPPSGARPAGWVGQITSNSFMKREFGSKLIEGFLAKTDLRLIVDTARAFIPGHATPTVIIVGRNQSVLGSTVRTVMGVRGEQVEPADPSEGIVWRAIVSHVDDAGWDDSWVTVADVSRERLDSHPWSLSGGGAAELFAKIEAQPDRLERWVDRIGMFGDSHADDLFATPAGSFTRMRADQQDIVAAINGDTVRDWTAGDSGELLLAPGPVDQPHPSDRTMRSMWPWRTSAWSRATFQAGTYRQSGRHWLSWHQISVHDVSRRRLVFAKISTHNHFASCTGSRVEKPSALRVELSKGVSDDRYVGTLGILNSSLSCFWLKQVCYDKGSGGNGRGLATEQWEHQHEYNAANVARLPLPSRLPLRPPRLLNALAQDETSSLPDSVVARLLPTQSELLLARENVRNYRRMMIAVQEELDWEVYGTYGLVPEDLTYSGNDLPGLALGERAFEIALARRMVTGDQATAWFARHGSRPIMALPAHWPAAYRNLVQRRLDLIASDPSVRLLEKPEYKRRWATEPWDKRQERALRGWLLDRLEDRRFWFDGQGRPTPCSVAQLADEVARDPDLGSVFALWEGRRDAPVTESLLRLLADEAVPNLAAHRYKDSGLRKREAWEQTWALQRREDAGEQVRTIPVPPKYTSADFRKNSYWQARGKLDVPKERFVLYPDAGRDTDPTPLLGWAGWDHAQQSLALSLVIGAREADGWADERLVPLVAGLAELQPWVEQWHGEIDPTYGVSLAAFCREQLNQRATQVGRSLDELRAWRPQPATRGRKPRRV